MFSYSVFQHFSKRDSLAAFEEIGRVLKPGGESLIQMANVYGAKSLWNQARERRFREPRTLFDVRYWGPARAAATSSAGASARPSSRSTASSRSTRSRTDLALLPARYRAVVRTLGGAAARLGDRRPLTLVADSVYARSRRG